MNESIEHEAGRVPETGAAEPAPYHVRGIPGPIHPEDPMVTRSDAAGFVHYLKVGRSALEAIDWAMSRCGAFPESIRSVLEFACGYGRITRHLVHLAPGARLMVSDVDPRGVSFCATSFGAEGRISTPDFQGLDLGRGHDLIMVGSLITHLPEDLVVRLLELFGAALAPGGTLVLTTHGPSCLEHAPVYGPDIASQASQLVQELETRGHTYRPYPGVVDYGVAFTDVRGMRRMVDRANRGLVHRGCWPRGWDAHQDVHALMRPRVP